MEFMVIETFKPGKKSFVYERFEEKGRMLPEGLEYVDSWVERNGNRCFQIMRTEKIELFDEWISAWQDLVEFEIIPIEPSPTKKQT